MCMGSPSIPAPPPPPAAPPPAPTISTPQVQQAGANARAKALAMMGPMATILNAGGPAGLVTPASTTAKSTLG